MLIDGHIINDFLKRYNITIKGVLHIGAHECEERGFYNNILKIRDDKIIWVDGNHKKVDKMKHQGISNIYSAVLDETERDIEFNITDNSQASSILTLNHEKGFYNNINIIEKAECKTEILSNFFRRIDRHPDNYNFWNLDIQGSELFVMRGSQELLHNCDVIYTEVNQEHVYKNCGLVSEIDELLGKFGFIRVHTIWTDMKWGDALYLKKKN
jgi:hypothetical protein